MLSEMLTIGGDVAPIDVTDYKASSSVETVASGDTFTLTGVTKKPRYVLVTYILTTSGSNPYFRNDFCDLVNNMVFFENKSTDSTSLNISTYALTDEVLYSGTTLTIKNKTGSGSRLMCAVAFY